MEWAARSTHDYDVVIVGAGPAGLTLAERLRSSGLRTCLLESGDVLPDLAAQRLLRAGSDGLPYWALDRTRHRQLGGSGTRWGGTCRPLDDLDLRTRAWVARSGWPVTPEQVTAYTAPAAAALGLTSDSFDPAGWGDRLPAELPLAGSGFGTVLFQTSPLTDFGGEHLAWLRAAPDTTAVLRATVTDIRLAPGGSRVGWLEVSTPGGGSTRVRARATVLAAGAVENARVLLAARRDRERGLGNERDQVGRYFMEHPHVPMGHLVPTDPGLDRRLYQRARYGGAVLRGALAPTAAAQREQELLSCSISVEATVYPYGSPFITWPAALTVPSQRLFLQLKRRRRTAGVAGSTPPDAVAGSGVSSDRVAGGLARGARATATTAWYAGRSLPARGAARASRRDARAAGIPSRTLFSLYVRSEQVPDPSNRVTLAPERDALGVPRARLHWQVGEQDRASMLAWVRHLDRAVTERGLGRVVGPQADWFSQVIGGPHHMGTTRMSASPADGVVDADSKVHTVADLYVAGSSVFATGGHANPTFTLVALSLRLADHLREVLTR